MELHNEHVKDYQLYCMMPEIAEILMQGVRREMMLRWMRENPLAGLSITS